MMANSISVTASLALSGLGVSVQLSPGALSRSMTGSKYVEGLMSVPTVAGGTAIPVSALANIGYAMLVNMDATNYVETLTAVGGSAVLKLLPGDVAVFRFDPAVTAPALLANTAAVSVQYLILEN